MITKIEARSPSGGLLSIELEDSSTGFIIKDVDGLDPVKASFVSSSYASMDGSQYQASHREARNLLLKIDLDPDYSTTSVYDLRKTLYNYFMPKSEVELRFYLDSGITVNLNGRVETFESPLFVRDPTVTIGLLCFDPDFIDLTPTVVSESTVDDQTNFTVSYDGTVDTGTLFELAIDRTLSEFTIYHQTPDGTLKTIDFAGSFVAGDVLKVSSVRGDKYVILNRGGTDSYVLYTKSPQSGWLELQNGSNLLRVYAVGAAIPFTITYYTRYGGL